MILSQNYQRTRVGVLLAVSILTAIVAGAITRRGDIRVHDAALTVGMELADSAVQSPYAVFIRVDKASETALTTPTGSRMREHFPRLLEILEEAGATAIVFDFLFAGEEPELDPTLAAAIERFPVVFAGVDSDNSSDVVLSSQIAAACTDLGSLEAGIVAGVPRYLTFARGAATPVSALAARSYAVSREMSGAPKIVELIDSRLNSGVR